TARAVAASRRRSTFDSGHGPAIAPDSRPPDANAGNRIRVMILPTALPRACALLLLGVETYERGIVGERLLTSKRLCPSGQGLFCGARLGAPDRLGDHIDRRVGRFLLLLRG